MKYPNEVVESNYALSTDTKWKYTFDSDILPMKNVVSCLTEKSEEELKQEAQVELSEGNIIKNFQSKPNPTFIKGAWVYDSNTDQLYKVIELETDDNSKLLSATLLLSGSTEKRELSSKDDVGCFQDYIYLSLIINQSEESNQVEVKHYINDKLENVIEPTISALGYSMKSIKILYKWSVITKETKISELKGIKQYDYLYLWQSIGKPSFFKRFPKDKVNSGWYNDASDPDVITFIPQRQVRIWGFTTFASECEDKYKLRYHIQVDNKTAEKDTVIASGWNDKQYTLQLKGVYEVLPFQKIDISIWISADSPSNGEVTTYYGSGGDGYETLQNYDMGLFEIKNNEDSENGTSLSSGHVSSIMYYLS